MRCRLGNLNVCANRIDPAGEAQSLVSVLRRHLQRSTFACDVTESPSGFRGSSVDRPATFDERIDAFLKVDAISASMSFTLEPGRLNESRNDFQKNAIAQLLTGSARIKPMAAA